MEALAGLTSQERGRLQQFAATFERVSAGQYPMFTEMIVTDAIRDAQARAIRLIGSGRRKAAVRAAVDAFVDEGARAYSRRMSLTDTFLLYQSLPDRAEDRVRFLATVERAVVALILWDELDPDDRGALLGPWGALVPG